MANELTISGSIKFAKGAKSVSLAKSGVQLDVAGDNYIQKTQSIGTSEEAIDLGDITIPGYAFFVNLDSTNFVSLRDATGADDMIDIPPGGIALFKFHAGATAPYAIADTAAVEIEYLIVEA